MHLRKMLFYLSLLGERIILAKSLRQNRGSNMSAHVLLNLLNELEKRDKNARLAEHFISFSQRV